MNWLNYLLEANLYVAIFYGCYWLLLRNHTFYTANRLYLVLTTMLSFALPFIQLGFLRPAVNVEPVAAVAVAAQSSTDMFMVYGYWLAAAAFALLFLFKVLSLLKLAYHGQKTQHDDYILVKLAHGQTAFSFFRYLFISNDQPLSDTILHHELVHIRQKHSVDVVLFELLKIVSWFNPVLYLAQRSLKELHEFIADEETARHQADTETYAMYLLKNAYGLPATELSNSFFNKNLLKIRILKLHQNPSGSLARLTYLIALPVCAGMLCASTLAFSKSYSAIDLLPKRDTAEKLRLVPGEVKMLKLTPVQDDKKKKSPSTKEAKSGQVTEVRFPPPRVIKDEKKASKAKNVKFPPPVVKADKKAAPSKKVEEIRIEEPEPNPEAVKEVKIKLLPPPPPPAKSVTKRPPPPPPVPPVKKEDK
jgi:hypothetical protein